MHTCVEIWLCSCIKVELLCQLKYSYLFILVCHKLNTRKLSFGSQGLNSECELEASVSVSGIIWVPHSVCGNHSNLINPVTTYLAEDSYKIKSCAILLWDILSHTEVSCMVSDKLHVSCVNLPFVISPFKYGRHQILILGHI